MTLITRLKNLTVGVRLHAEVFGLISLLPCPFFLARIYFFKVSVSATFRGKLLGTPTLFVANLRYAFN